MKTRDRDIKATVLFIAVILISVIWLAGCGTTTIEETTFDEEGKKVATTKSKYKKGDYKAKVEADALADSTAKEREHELAMAKIEEALGPACPAPKIAGAPTDAAKIVAEAYRDCILMNGGTTGKDSYAEVVRASNGNSKSPSAQMYRSHNKKVAALEHEKTVRQGQWVNLAAVTVPFLGYAWLSNNGGRGTASGSQSIGDNNTITMRGSNSGEFSGGEGGGELGAGFSAESAQTRQLQMSIFGRNSQGFAIAEPNSRQGFTLAGYPMINDLSGVQNANEGTQKGTTVTDDYQLNDSETRFDDRDGHIF